MKFVFALLLAISCPVTVSAAFQPDVRISYRFAGAAVRHPSGHFLVPVDVTVVNGGDEIAGRFKIAVQYSHVSFSGFLETTVSSLRNPDGSFTSDGHYTWTSRAIFPGRTATFRASILVPKAIPRGATVYFRFHADSCAGDEFMPFFCRVQESDERNNYSLTKSIVLP
jgi:hypothetical protein